jgi:hypothetical protein
VAAFMTGIYIECRSNNPDFQTRLLRSLLLFEQERAQKTSDRQSHR